MWLDGDLFYLPSDFFCSTLLYSIHFSPPVTICFKNRTFLLPLSRELHAEMQLRFFVCFVFCLTSVESKHQSNEYNQAGANDFQCLFGHFEYVGYLLHTIAIFFRLSLFNPVWLFATPGDCSRPGSSVHGDSPGKNAGVGCHALLQGIFLTQGSNPCLLHL